MGTLCKTYIMGQMGSGEVGLPRVRSGEVRLGWGCNDQELSNRACVEREHYFSSPYLSYHNSKVDFS